jgi:NAD(P)-dependent dehydrogenase (short-subunit alcohol dehydrogenase family)
MNGRLKDRVALVTGAGAGMGKATALRLAAEGAAVVCLDIRGMHETAEEVTAAGNRAVAMQCDVGREEDWRAVRDRTCEDFGRIDILANVAGLVINDTVAEMTNDRLNRLLDVNLRGPLLGMREVLPLMVAQQAGKVVNVSTSGTLLGAPNHASYSASKGGLNAVTLQAAVEYASCNIQINCVCPGATNTAMVAQTPDETMAVIRSRIPAQRIAEPSELAAVIAFLASSDSDYLSGAIIPADGGMVAS